MADPEGRFALMHNGSSSASTNTASLTSPHRYTAPRQGSWVLA